MRIVLLLNVINMNNTSFSFHFFYFNLLSEHSFAVYTHNPSNKNKECLCGLSGF